VPGEGGNAEASSPGAPSATAADAGGGALERDEPRNAAPGEARPARLDGAVADARLALATLGGPRSASAGAVKDGEGGARRSGRYDPRLLPTAATFAQLSGGSPTAQSLPGVAEGDTTSLNTRRFRFADFYARVSDAVRREWDPNRAWDAKDPYSSRYGRTLRAATVDIVLTTDGAVREVRVVNSSGFAFYDRELVRAIAAAAPFPNPPAALANADGLIVLDYTFALRWKPGFLPRALSGVGAVAAPSASAAVPGSR
jgi:TonB family protein